MPDEKTDWKDLAKKARAWVEDPLSLTVTFHSGKIEGDFMIGSRIDWIALKRASLSTEDSRLKIVSSFTVWFDGDCDLFVSDDPSVQELVPMALERVSEMTDKGIATREKLADLFKNLFRLVNLIPGI
jgi:hypothetical protein